MSTVHWALLATAAGVTLYAYLPPGHFDAPQALGTVLWIAIVAMAILSAGSQPPPRTEAALRRRTRAQFKLFCSVLVIVLALCITAVRTDFMLRLHFTVFRREFDALARAVDTSAHGATISGRVGMFEMYGGTQAWDRITPFLVRGDSENAKKQLVYVPDAAIARFQSFDVTGVRYRRLSQNWFVGIDERR